MLSPSLLQVLLLEPLSMLVVIMHLAAAVYVGAHACVSRIMQGLVEFEVITTDKPHHLVGAQEVRPFSIHSWYRLSALGRC